MSCEKQFLGFFSPCFLILLKYILTGKNGLGHVYATHIGSGPWVLVRRILKWMQFFRLLNY